MSRRRVAAVATLLALAAIVSGAVPAGAAGASLSVTPAIDLVDGQYVKVTLQNVPSVSGNFRTCQLDATLSNYHHKCTAPDSTVGTTDATGTGSTYLQIHATNDPLLTSEYGTWPSTTGSAVNFGYYNGSVTSPTVITSAPAGTARNDITGPVGMRFAPGATDVIVTELGREFVSGNQGTHLLAIYPGDGGPPLLYGSCNLTMNQTTAVKDAAGVAYNYCTLQRGVTLVHGQTYIIASAEDTGGDRWIDITGQTVSTGVGSITGGAFQKSEPLSCDSAHPCQIIFNWYDASQNATRVIVAGIAFAPSPDNCPSQAGSILGSGSAEAYRAMYAWQSVACLPPLDLGVQYTYSNSVDGIANLTSAVGPTDFAVVGPLAAAPAAGASDPYWRAPVAASGVVLAYRMSDPITGTPITSLTLTPSLIAKLFSGQIDNFATPTDPNAIAVRNLNPGVTFPGGLNLFARADHSEITYVFTSWLTASAPADWPQGQLEIFPNTPHVFNVLGSSAVGIRLRDATVDPTHIGGMGYMDSSTAAYLGLPTVKIVQADGSIVAATPDTIARALSDSTAADGTITLNFANLDKDDAAYPVLMPSYVLVPKTVTWDKGAVIAPFIRFAVNASLGQSSAILPAGYAPISDRLRAAALAVADLLPATAPAQPSPSPTPQAFASPSPSNLSSLPPFNAGGSGASSSGSGSTASSSSRTRRAPCPTPSPSPGVAASAARTTPASSARTTTTGTVPDYCLPIAKLSDNQGSLLAWTVQSADRSLSRYLLPAIGALGLLAVGIGGGAEFLGARLRPQTPEAAAP